jgi:predicted ABC-type ATPase
VLAGINGAGKTTASAEVLRAEGLVESFVNADAIARGLNGLNPESVAMQAGQVMLERINKLVTEGENFAIETTLAGRTYFAWLRNAKANHGYQVLRGSDTSPIDWHETS